MSTILSLAWQRYLHQLQERPLPTKVRVDYMQRSSGKDRSNNTGGYICVHCLAF